MAKYIFLVRSPEKLELQMFSSQIFDKLVHGLLELEPQKLKISLTEYKKPRFTILPLKATAVALVSIWGELDGDIERWQAEMTSTGGRVTGYRVTESTPVAYEKDWEDGNASPGMVLLTLMKKNAKLSYEQFMDEWFGHHTPMALRIHPLWNYTRNVVESVVIEDSPPFDGIVEEHFRSLGDITNPARFFGGAFRMLPNILKVYRHTNKFMKISATENYLLTEYHIRS
ncbi:MAG TPA: EthD domain-containing protein [Dehalococcoidia bacterium]|nr:EthD domain-containing protein [Dehalococcoidia bacterium]